MVEIAHGDSLTEEMLEKIKPLETDVLEQPHIEEQAVTATTTGLENDDADPNPTEAGSELLSIAKVTEELKSILAKKT